MTGANHPWQCDIERLRCAFCDLVPVLVAVQGPDHSAHSGIDPTRSRRSDFITRLIYYVFYYVDPSVTVCRFYTYRRTISHKKTVYEMSTLHLL